MAGKRCAGERSCSGFSPFAYGVNSPGGGVRSFDSDALGHAQSGNACTLQELQYGPGPWLE